ncbi:polysaccharide deacetylase WbmS family protein [Marinilabilia rubra]|uniref:Polysaccharide deacetylase n=1 Tax=Marinilabilia rubra TaxID=2162893 RepID=A0A2U2BBC9_9BACT|nr:hypothetical protein [Marinilabilia rubra]PWE00343.1 hypothetical protein DDZ16_05225 [Marinilabilia rubra]
MKVAITIDVDWAPDKVLEHTLKLFSKAGVPCTIFATHRTSLLSGLDQKQFEIGVHPNFNPLFDGDKRHPVDVVAPLREAFPGAMGIRSHSSLVSNVLVEMFGEMGFQYESNICLPYSKKLEVLPLWNGMMRIPFNWEDYLHFSFGKSFRDADLDFSEGLHILNFHPVHIFLNTETRERYEGARPFYQDPEHLYGYRNLGRGTATLLEGLLMKNYPFVKLEDIFHEQKVEI